MFDDSVGDSEEGSCGKEGNVFEDEEQLLQKRFSTHQISWLVGEVDFCIDLGNDEQGAEDGRERKFACD